MAGGVAGPSLDALLALAVVNDEDVGAGLTTRCSLGGTVLDPRGVAVAVGQAGSLGVVAGLDVPPVPGGDKRRWVNMKVCSSYSRLHTGLSHSPCATYIVQTGEGQHERVQFIHQATFRSLASPCTAVQREDNMRVFSSHNRPHSCLSHSPCTVYTDGGQHEDMYFTQQATFLSLALTMYCIHRRGTT